MNIITPSSNSKDLQKDIWLAISLSFLFAFITFYWLILDHRLPSQDQAGHILNCYGMRDVFLHCRIWKSHWWYEVFTVNRYYPPTYYITGGIFHVIFGQSHFTDICCIVLFNALLSVTIFGIARYVKMSRLAAVLAVILINCFPLVSFLSHAFLLDLPLLSMISLGIWSLLFWHDKPGWYRSVLSGLILIAACMTKQLAAPYILGTGIFLVADSLGVFGKEKNIRQVLQLIVIALIALIGCLPWLLVNLSFIHTGFAAVKNILVARGAHYSWITTLGFYLHNLPADLSPLLLICALLGIFTSPKKTHFELLPITLSTLIGVVLLLCNHQLLPRDERYIVPATISFALYAALGISYLYHLRSRVASVLSLAIIVLVCLQFISFNFAPYPLSKPRFLAGLSKVMGVHLGNSDIFAGTSDKDNPRTVNQDWGQEFVLSEIHKIDHNNPSWLNVMANHPDMNAHTFEFLTKTNNSPVRPTTSRINTLIGDQVFFDPKTALYFDWYLFKDGDSGFVYFDKNSSTAANSIRKFVESSGHFQLIAKKPLPDGTNLYLYRQLPLPKF